MQLKEQLLQLPADDIWGPLLCFWYLMKHIIIGFILISNEEQLFQVHKVWEFLF